MTREILENVGLTFQQLLKDTKRTFKNLPYALHGVIRIAGALIAIEIQKLNLTFQDGFVAENIFGKKELTKILQILIGVAFWEQVQQIIYH